MHVPSGFPGAQKPSLPWGTTPRYTPAAEQAPVGLDPEEQVQEAVRENRIAAYGARVAAAERSEDQAPGVEVEHRRQVVDAAQLVLHALVADRHPVLARVPAADPDADRERAEVGVGLDRRLPENEHERHEEVGGVAGHPVRLAGALPDIPGMHAVVHELAGGIE